MWTVVVMALSGKSLSLSAILVKSKPLLDRSNSQGGASFNKSSPGGSVVVTSPPANPIYPNTMSRYHMYISCKIMMFIYTYVYSKS